MFHANARVASVARLRASEDSGAYRRFSIRNSVRGSLIVHDAKKNDLLNKLAGAIGSQERLLIDVRDPQMLHSLFAYGLETTRENPQINQSDWSAMWFSNSTRIIVTRIIHLITYFHCIDIIPKGKEIDSTIQRALCNVIELGPDAETLIQFNTLGIGIPRDFSYMRYDPWIAEINMHQQFAFEERFPTYLENNLSTELHRNYSLPQHLILDDHHDRFQLIQSIFDSDIEESVKFYVSIIILFSRLSSEDVAGNVYIHPLCLFDTSAFDHDSITQHYDGTNYLFKHISPSLEYSVPRVIFKDRTNFTSALCDAHLSGQQFHYVYVDKINIILDVFNSDECGFVTSFGIVFTSLSNEYAVVSVFKCWSENTGYISHTAFSVKNNMPDCKNDITSGMLTEAMSAQCRYQCGNSGANASQVFRNACVIKCLVIDYLNDSIDYSNYSIHAMNTLNINYSNKTKLMRFLNFHSHKLIGNINVVERTLFDVDKVKDESALTPADLMSLCGFYSMHYNEYITYYNACIRSGIPMLSKIIEGSMEEQIISCVKLFWRVIFPKDFKKRFSTMGVIGAGSNMSKFSTLFFMQYFDAQKFYAKIRSEISRTQYDKFHIDATTLKDLIERFQKTSATAQTVKSATMSISGHLTKAVFASTMYPVDLNYYLDIISLNLNDVRKYRVYAASTTVLQLESLSKFCWHSYSEWMASRHVIDAINSKLLSIHQSPKHLTQELLNTVYNRLDLMLIDRRSFGVDVYHLLSDLKLVKDRSGSSSTDLQPQVDVSDK